ncbi:MAG: transglycosylase domain-containing protein [Ktedonobacteraceae bacterium]
MAADPPLSQEQTLHNISDDETAPRLQVPSPAIEVSTLEKSLDHSDEANGQLHSQPASTGERRTGGVKRTTSDPITPDIQLTPRQQRVLTYLGRRRMRNAHISKRISLDDKAEAIAPDDDGAAIAGDQAISTSPLIPLEPQPLPQKEQHTREIQSQVEHLEIPSARIQTPVTARTLALPVLPISSVKTQKVWRRRKQLRYLTRKHLRIARKSEDRARIRLWLTIGSTFLLLLVIFLSLGTAGAVLGYRFYTQTQTKYEQQVVTLHDLLPLDNLKMYDSKGVPIMQMTDQGIHTTVSLDQVASILVDATVATEDKNFWTNQGIDILRILRAALDDLRSGHVIEGGSTITQQLIKNLVVGNQTTLIRKLEEVVLTPQVNNHYSKRDIMEMYLNSIYYGEQAYGIDAAATIYFGLEDKPGKRAAMQLDLAQATMIAGIPSNPSLYDPLAHPQAAFARFQTVLDLMVTQQYIRKVDALDAIQEAQSPHFFKTAPVLTNRAPHFANLVLSQLVKEFHLKDQSQLSRSGMLVYTTLDIHLQDKIQKIAQQHIAELRDTHHVTNAAEVLIDFHTGAIISLLGSIDYNNNAIDGQVDVTQSYRQPGSSFKPYVYVTAFAQGASPAQAIDDTPTTIDIPDGDPSTYSPHNYDMSYHGHMTLRCALQNSLNVPAVRVLRHVGINAAMQTAQSMGITTYSGTPGYSLVLGGLGVRLIDHTSAIGTFANGGVHVPYYAVNKVISGTTGKTIYQHQANPGQRVISPQLAYMMTNVLSDNTSRIPEFFDCNVLQLYSNSQTACYNGNRGQVRPAAAKTGTTQNFRDNWTVGYTTDYVMGVWAGNDDNTPMDQVTGVMGAAPIWHDAMLVAESGHPIRNFINPGGLQRATVTYADGVKTTDWFLPGTVPVSVQPTATPGATGTPTTEATSTPTDTPTPGTDNEQSTSGNVHPYCPSSYSFAFNPPANDPSGNGWW